MANQELSFNELERVFTAHGCNFEFDKKTRYIKITVGSGAQHRFFHVHAHKGTSDSFDKNVVRLARRRLGFANMPDDEFYAPAR